MAARKNIDKRLRMLCKQNASAAFIVIDIDDCRLLNDKIGIAQTDKVIKRIGNIIKTKSNNSDVLYGGRIYGGDEFGIIITGRNANGIYAIAEDIRKTVSDSLKITVSMGVAIRKHNETKDVWWKRAETELGKAKCKGKNRICLSGNESDEPKHEEEDVEEEEEEEKDMEEEEEEKEQEDKISNPLVLIIGLSEYDKHEENDLNLPFVEKDKQRFRKVCTHKYYFTVCPSNQMCKKYKNKKRWTKRDIFMFLEEAREHVFYPDSDELKHDAIILYFSGHGGVGSIVSSELKEIQISEIQNKIGGVWKFDMTTIPKVCIWDCCRGHNEAAAVAKGTFSAHKDELFCSLYGNSPGIVSKGNADGSFFTRALCESLTKKANVSITKLTKDTKKRLKKISNDDQLAYKEGDADMDDYKIVKH